MKEYWYGFDLDGTAAHWGGWADTGEILAPIPGITQTMRDLLDQGEDVRFLTARVAHGDRWVQPIREWSEKHLGVALPVTCRKDSRMYVLYDDRAQQVVRNKGITVEQVIDTMRMHVAGSDRESYTREEVAAMMGRMLQFIRGEREGFVQ